MKNEINEQQGQMIALRDSLASVEADRSNGIYGVTLDELDQLLSDIIDDTH